MDIGETLPPKAGPDTPDVGPDVPRVELSIEAFVQVAKWLDTYNRPREGSELGGVHLKLPTSAGVDLKELYGGIRELSRRLAPDNLDREFHEPSGKGFTEAVTALVSAGDVLSKTNEGINQQANLSGKVPMNAIQDEELAKAIDLVIKFEQDIAAFRATQLAQGAADEKGSKGLLGEAVRKIFGGKR